VIALEALLGFELLVAGDLGQQRSGRSGGVGETKDGSQLAEESLAFT